jgi:hypothetical protein
MSNSELLTEKDVENFYRQHLKKLFPNSKITSPYKTDGILECGNLKMLLEFKLDLDFTKKDNKAIALIQSIVYLKKIENSANVLPQVVFIGDKNECFVLHTNVLLHYLSYNANWDCAPSNAHKEATFQQMRIDLNADENISSFTFSPSDKTLKDKILDLNDKTNRKIRVTISNIENVYKYFISSNIIKHELNTNENANLFVQIITNSDSNYLHPKKKNILVTNSYGDIKINSDAYKSFFNHFDNEAYSQKEKKEIINCVDTLIDDAVRRRKGEYYTPKIWVDKAHEYISETFGENWKTNFVVWDNSCGLGALTKDYKFDNLIQTTLELSDIETLQQNNINVNSIKLKMNFLNDEIPFSILETIKDKDLLFVFNPPYKTSGNNKRDSESDEGVAISKTRDDMIKDKWSGYGQLYAQFIYKSLQIRQYCKSVSLAVFAPPLYLSSSSFKNFRNEFFKYVEFSGGFLFRADEFSGTASNWSIAFSMFKAVENNIQIF